MNLYDNYFCNEMEERKSREQREIHNAIGRFFHCRSESFCIYREVLSQRIVILLVVICLLGHLRLICSSGKDDNGFASTLSEANSFIF